jgi:hypothetical protein
MKRAQGPDSDGDEEEPVVEVVNMNDDDLDSITRNADLSKSTNVESNKKNKLEMGLNKNLFKSVATLP